jgi:N-acetylneuraminic acid mutarotase
MPLPVELHHPAMAAAAGRIYVTGGYDSILFRANRATTFVFDPAAGTWSEAAAMPGARAAHAMVSVDDKLFVIGWVGDYPDAVWV